MSETQVEVEGPEFVVEVVDDTPEADRGRPKAPEATENDDDLSVPGEEIASYRKRVQKRVSDLSAKAHAERRAKEAAAKEREAAVRYAETLAQENEQLRGLAANNERLAFEQAKQRTTAMVAQAKRNVRDAMETGDTEKIVDAQSALHRLIAEDDRIAGYQPRQAPPPQQERREPPKKVEIPEPDARAQKWAESNAWFGTDQEMTGTAYGVHEKLVKEGVDPSSADYYNRIDAVMRKRYPEAFQVEEPEPARNNRPVVAPANRSVRTPRVVTLTASQVALARRLNLTNEQYAAQVVKDQQHG